MADQTHHYRIPAELLQAIVAYLAQRPYAEVTEAIQALRALEPCDPKEPD